MHVHGNYRLVLHPGVEPGDLEALLLGEDPGFQLQLTRVTISVGFDLQRVLGTELAVTRQYVVAATVQLMSEGVRYDFEQNLDRIQDAVKDFATVLGVDVLETVDAVPQPV